MAWSRVQSVGAAAGLTNGVFTQTVTLGSTPTTGNVLVAVCGANHSASIPVFSSIKDGGGNSFTTVEDSVYSVGGSNGFSAVGVLVVPASPSTTVTMTITNNPAGVGSVLMVTEFSGTTATLDGTVAVNQQASGTVTQPAYSSTASSELLLSCYGDDGENPVSGAGGSWTADTNNVNNSSHAQACLQWKNSTNGAETGGTWSSPSGGPAVNVVFALKQAGGGTTANAGNAAVTVAANNPVAQVTATPSAANVTVAGLAPSASTGTNASPTAGVAAVTVAALTPTISFSPSSVGVGNVTAAALQPSVALVAKPTVANVTVAGLAPLAKLTVLPSAANVTVGAYNPSVSISGNITATAGVANVTVAGLNATGLPTLIVTAGVAAVTVAALTPTASLTALPTVANVTVAGLTALAKLTVFPTVANVTVAAINPSVSAGGNITATPGATNVTVAAYNPSVAISLTVTAGNAAVAVAAYNPSVTVGGNVTATAGVAAVTVAALGPVPQVSPAMAAATVIASALVVAKCLIVFHAGNAAVTVAALNARFVPPFTIGVLSADVEPSSILTAEDTSGGPS